MLCHVDDDPVLSYRDGHIYSQGKVQGKYDYFEEGLVPATAEAK